MVQDKIIYLDNASTTIVKPEVLDAYCKAKTQFFANPSSIHICGQEAGRLLDKAREQILNTLNVPVTNDTKNLDEIVASDVATHLALAEQYRRRAEYDKAAKEYQAVAQTKTDRGSKSEVYYEIAVMYLDAEEFSNAKSCAEIAMATDENDLTDTLPALIDYYTKRSNSAIEQLETILKQNP